MNNFFQNIVNNVLQPLQHRYVQLVNPDNEERPGNWSIIRGQHAFGDYSFAVVQANDPMEDFSQVEIGETGTFVGVYDGHGGPDTSAYVSQHLFGNIIDLARREQGLINQHILLDAFDATENGFVDFVRDMDPVRPALYGIGSCCLVGLIMNRTLYIANLGDSRAVLARDNPRHEGRVLQEQLTRDHNVNDPDERRQVQVGHPDGDDVVTLDDHGVWRVKGIIQISRSIGDLYLKRPEFLYHPLTEAVHEAVLRSDPAIFTRVIQPGDRFVVFASDGLWERLGNQEVVDIAHRYRNCPEGIAKRLVRDAIKVAARRSRPRRLFRTVRRLPVGQRRHIHDDISVIVLYFDHNLLGNNAQVNEISVKPFREEHEASLFRNLYAPLPNPNPNPNPDPNPDPIPPEGENEDEIAKEDESEIPLARAPTTLDHGPGTSRDDAGPSGVGGSKSDDDAPPVGTAKITIGDRTFPVGRRASPSDGGQSTSSGGPTDPSGDGPEPSVVPAAPSGDGPDPLVVPAAPSGDGPDPSGVPAAPSGDGPEPSVVPTAPSGDGPEPSVVPTAHSGDGPGPSGGGGSTSSGEESLVR